MRQQLEFLNRTLHDRNAEVERLNAEYGALKQLEVRRTSEIIEFIETIKMSIDMDSNIARMIQVPPHILQYAQQQQAGGVNLAHGVQQPYPMRAQGVGSGQGGPIGHGGQ